MPEHEPDPVASIEHLDWQPEAEGMELIEPELPTNERLSLVNDLMHRLGAGEPRVGMLDGEDGWDALERRIGSKYMKELFGNRKENE